MKINYNQLSTDYIYPLSKKEVNEALKNIPDSDLEKIRRIEFGCNKKTTQEGRTVQHGRFYDIRINFCLQNLTSLLLSDDNKYLNRLRLFTNGIDQDNRIITWKLTDAKRYALFLLFHEIGHVIYSEHHSSTKMKGPTSNNEEKWCDSYAMERTT